LLRYWANQCPFPDGNGNVAQTTGYAVDTYLVGSSVAAPYGSTVNPNTGGFLAKGRYTCDFDMTKTAAGVATPIITLRVGLTASLADAAICTFTFAAGTAAIDSGTFQVWANFYSAGPGTSAVIAGLAALSHNLAATGLSTTGAAGFGQVANTSAGFNSATPGLFIGCSFNGGAAFAGTNNVVQANMFQP
jgi:hypothetical protein